MGAYRCGEAVVSGSGELDGLIEGRELGRVAVGQNLHVDAVLIHLRDSAGA